MPSSFSKTFIASLLGGLIVAGCGGGGSSSGSGTGAATTFPLSTALGNLYATGLQKPLTVTGTATSVSDASKNSTFTAQVIASEGPANAGATFQSQAVRQIDVSLTGTFNLNGTNGTFSSATSDFLSASNQLIGTSSGTGSSSTNCVANAPGQYPDTVTVGQSQSVVTYACRNTSDNAPIGTGKLDFLVSAGSSPGTAVFSTLERFLDIEGNLAQFTQKNYLIDTSGNISLQSFSFFGALTSTSGATTPSDLQFNFKSQ